jgi:hypothetical protein
MIMNPVQAEISQRLRKLPAELRPIRDAALRHVQRCSSVDIEGTIQIAHRPWSGCENYAIRLFPPPPRAWLAKFEKEFRQKIPQAVRAILSGTNGAFLFELDLFGLTPSLMRKPALLDRSRAQCLALQLANTHWKRSYQVDPEWFYFGCGLISPKEHSGYFIAGEDEIVAARKCGEILHRWTSLSRFLSDEIRAAERQLTEEVPASWWH